MAIAYVGERGAPTHGGASGTSSWVVSPSVDCVAGNHLVLCVTGRNASVTGVSVADSKSNTWTVHKFFTDASPNEFTAVASCHLTSAILATDTITISSTGTTMGPSIVALLEEFSGIASSSYEDTPTVASASDLNGTSHSIATAGNVTNPGELVVVASFISIPTASGSAGTNYTAFPTQPVTSGATSGDRKLFGQYRIGPSSGAVETAAFSTSASSATDAIIVALKAGASAPVNTVAPAVTGTATVGQTLSTTTGTWTDNGSPTFTYQWQDSADGSTGWANIASATASTYVIASGEATKYIKCVVTDTDANGATAASSNVVGPVSSSATSGSASGGVNFPTPFLINP